MQTNSGERVADIQRKKAVLAETLVGDRNKKNGLVAPQYGRCTQSQFGRTAPPEAEEFCPESKMRARTIGARDCVRYVFSSSSNAQLTIVRCRRHAQIYGSPCQQGDAASRPVEV